jgi:hypothetical protein
MRWNVYDSTTGRERSTADVRRELRRRIERARGVGLQDDDSPERRFERAASAARRDPDPEPRPILVERATGEVTRLGDSELAKADEMFRPSFDNIVNQPAWKGTEYER